MELSTSLDWLTASAVFVGSNSTYQEGLHKQAQIEKEEEDSVPFVQLMDLVSCCALFTSLATDGVWLIAVVVVVPQNKTAGKE